LLKRLEPVDLHDWKDGEHPEFDRLVHVLQALLTRPQRPLSLGASNLRSEWSVDHQLIAWCSDGARTSASRAGFSAPFRYADGLGLHMLGPSN
jgi:hypothetical protein